MCLQSGEGGRGFRMEPLSNESQVVPEIAPESSSRLPEAPDAQAQDEAWRDEVAARLTRYRARRKAPPPRYPSLRLPFAGFESSKKLAAEAPTFEPVSNQALALEVTSLEPQVEENPQTEPSAYEPPPPRPVVNASAKIIEFPRFAWGPPAPPPDQLAEPVTDRPRILDVPEIQPAAPALGGITIEPIQTEENARRPGIDVPLYAAPLGLRVFASLIDGFIVGSASALFAFIFSKIAAFQPPRLQLIALAAAIPCIFWAAYRYLLIVYSGTTPGLRAANLELVCFNGAPTVRSQRRWRVLASYLSAASLGMGYAWLFLDEDSLCWHDRITRTYSAPRMPGKQR